MTREHSDDAARDTEPVEEQPRRWRRFWIVAAVIVVLLGLLVGGAELLLRAVIPNVIAGVVRDKIGLSQQHEVDVELGGSALVPALGGHVGSVDLRIPDLEVVDGIAADVSAHADSIPFDPTKGRIEGAAATATIGSDSVGPLLALVTDGVVDDGTVKDGLLEVSKTLQLFGYDVQVSAEFGLSVQDGNLVIDPSSINAAGFNLTAEQLRPLLGDNASALLDTRSVCLRDRLPEGVTLTDIELQQGVLGGSAAVTAKFDPELLSDPTKQQFGSCEAP